MNYLATKRAAALGAVLVAVVTGCTSPAPQPSATPKDVEVARVEAATRLDDMPFLENPHDFTKELQTASSAAEIEGLIRSAEAENKTRGETYWSCVSDLTDLLVGEWNTQAVDATGKKFNDYHLVLAPDDAAALNLVGTAQLMVSIDATPISEWLTSAVGEITSWTSDLENVVSDRTLPAGTRPEMSGTQVCVAPFNLSLTSNGTTDWDAEIRRGFRGDITLVVGGQPFDLIDE